MLRAASLLLCLATLGCSKPTPVAPPVQAKALPPAPPSAWRVWGKEGRGPGEYVTPRGVGLAPDHSLYVVDRSGRVQHLDPDGKPIGEWTLPEYARGFPEDVEVAPWGEVLVVDTHYYRILRYKPDGTLLGSWGSFGDGSGHFSFAVGVTFVGDETCISEYQGTDRVQVFDREGKVLRSWGAFGEEDGQFNRPEDLCWDERRQRFIVADTTNHRISTYTREGKWICSWGHLGEGPGEFKYPYDVDLTPDGRIVVCEYGNNRIQILDTDGRPLGTLGGPGSEPGQFACPWDCAVVPREGADPWLVVVDSRNHRLQRYEGPIPR